MRMYVHIYIRTYIDGEDIFTQKHAVYVVNIQSICVCARVCVCMCGMSVRYLCVFIDIHRCANVKTNKAHSFSVSHAWVSDNPS